MKALYYIYGVVCIALCVWAVLSYVDALSYNFNLTYNLFKLALELTQ